MRVVYIVAKMVCARVHVVWQLCLHVVWHVAKSVCACVAQERKEFTCSRTVIKLTPNGLFHVLRGTGSLCSSDMACGVGGVCEEIDLRCTYQAELKSVDFGSMGQGDKGRLLVSFSYFRRIFKAEQADLVSMVHVDIGTCL